MDLKLAQSKAGHDIGQIYVVIEENSDMVLLVNGNTKTIQKPKKKKKIHVQIIKNVPADIQAIADEYKQLDDLSIKRIIKEFSRRIKNV